jgi:hypothetical protein
MTYHQVCDKSDTTGVTCGAGTTNPSRVHEFIPDFGREVMKEERLDCDYDKWNIHGYSVTVSQVMMETVQFAMID